MAAGLSETVIANLILFVFAVPFPTNARISLKIGSWADMLGVKVSDTCSPAYMHETIEMERTTRMIDVTSSDCIT